MKQANHEIVNIKKQEEEIVMMKKWDDKKAKIKQKKYELGGEIK